MTITILGRPISRKNHTQVLRARGRTFVSPSKAYKRFEGDALYQLSQQAPKSPLTHTTHAEITFFIKGRYRVDIDNLISGICDILERGKVIENDNLITSLSAKKINESDDWKTIINLEAA